MIGKPRLDNIQELVRDVFARDVPGDFLEAGSWRGGAVIFMKACVQTYGEQSPVQRKVGNSKLSFGIR